MQFDRPPETSGRALISGTGTPRRRPDRVTKSQSGVRAGNRGLQRTPLPPAKTVPLPESGFEGAPRMKCPSKIHWRRTMETTSSTIGKILARGTIAVMLAAATVPCVLSAAGNDPEDMTAAAKAKNAYSVQILVSDGIIPAPN